MCIGALQSAVSQQASLLELSIPHTFVAIKSSRSLYSRICRSSSRRCASVLCVVSATRGTPCCLKYQPSLRMQDSMFIHWPCWGMRVFLGLKAEAEGPRRDVEESTSQSGNNREVALSCISNVTSPFFFSPFLQTTNVRIERIN